MAKWRLPNLAALQAYVGSLSDETLEWVLALYVDEFLNLLMVDTVAKGSVSSAPLPIGRVIGHALRLNAAGFFLVHNHPSGNPTPSRTDIDATRKIARCADDCGVPLLSHFIITSAGLQTVGEW